MTRYSEKELDKLPKKNGFRLRGLDMTRLETFLDAAFAFAVTMLVISIDRIPSNYTELLNALKGVPAFGACFAIMMFFWVSHRKWSRYYGLEDGVSIFISLTLIFVLLIYIYPLKLMFSAFFFWVSRGWFPSEFTVNSGSEIIGLFIVYGLGAAAMALLMVLLYHRAKKAKDKLGLNQVELIHTDSEIASWLAMGITGFVSAFWAMVMPGSLAVYAGFFYTTLGISMTWIGIHYDKKLRQLKQKPQ